jgi:probable phosphoglycerate mutase
LANAAMDRGMGRASAGPTDPKAEPKHESRATPYPKDPAAAPPIAPPMLRGFTRGGVVHLLGDARLPDGIFVKIVPE